MPLCVLKADIGGYGYHNTNHDEIRFHYLPPFDIKHPRTNAALAKLNATTRNFVGKAS